MFIKSACVNSMPATSPRIGLMSIISIFLNEAMCATNPSTRDPTSTCFSGFRSNIRLATFKSCKKYSERMSPPCPSRSCRNGINCIGPL